MPVYMILAQSQATARALNAWLELLGAECPEEHRMVWEGSLGRERFAEVYGHLAWRIEGAIREGEEAPRLNRDFILVDAVSPKSMSAVEEAGTWDSLVAMLVLSFPEVRWVFGAYRATEQPDWWEEHNLPALLRSARRDPVFDPSGLREAVRETTTAELKNADDHRLPARKQKAAAIDEELSYAYLHGYTAYRFGFRTDIVTTWEQMAALFGCKDVPRKEEPCQTAESKHGYWLLLEDMSLNFPDKPKRVHLLHLARDAEVAGPNRNRACHCPRLDSGNSHAEDSEYRILVTTGQSRRGDDALAQNRAYLRKKAYGRGSVVLKPASGMFDLWQKAGLMRKPLLGEENRDIQYCKYLEHVRCGGKPRQGNAPGFFWPPSPQQPVAENRQVEAKGHGAPGRLLLVAEMLIERAEALSGKVRSVSGAVLGATLATDALELTGGRSPTTAIEALSLKHQFEVMAECQFSGVEYHIKMQPRLDEIALETGEICRWFHKRQRENAQLNARMHILNSLVRILREYNQFDEEQLCMNGVRRLHSTLWMRAQPWRYIFWPFIRYVELLLSSMLTFVSVVFGWVLVLSVLFALVYPGSGDWAQMLGFGAENAVTSFFSVGPPIQHGDEIKNLSIARTLVIAVCIISGFLHLGVFISHLYTVASRR